MKNFYLKKILVTLALLFISHIVSAQVETMSGFVAGSSLASGGNGTYTVIGETFTGSTVENGYELSQGLAQAQLVRKTYTATVNEGDGYTGNGFSFPATTPTGSYKDSVYEVQGADYKYDLLKILKIMVIPATACGALVYDGDLNDYPTVALAGYCWTQRNMKAQHYADGTTEISKALVYRSNMYPNEADNEDTYGRLYTWYSAVNVPENSAVAPTPDVNGFVQGICPNGWHIPTGTEMAALLSFPAEAIRSTNLWLQPNANTNSTNFTALPAGFYNSGTDRFEGLLGITDFWTDQAVSTLTSSTLSLQYFCSTPLFTEKNAADAWSVRCVKNY